MPDRRERIAARSARRAGEGLVRIRATAQEFRDLFPVGVALALLLVGVALAVSTAVADRYLHRGIETGEELPAVVQPTGSGLATNVDLTFFPPNEIAAVTATLRESGFTYVRQPFSWRTIERRPGQMDWATHDAIIDELTRQGIRIVAVVHDAPDWARDPLPAGAIDGPPRDPATFGAFVEALTSRYGDRLPFVQLWETPNDPAYWGGKSADGHDYLPLLAAGFNAARTGNPGVKVLSAELAVDPSEPDVLSDTAFLERLYAAGGASFFDILGVRVDGGQSSPEDRRVSPERINFSRAILMRELMIRAGDVTTPIWATSFGWAVGGDVSAENQADFAVNAIQRSWAEWPWMGLLFHWSFVAEPESADADFAMVGADGRAKPLYLAVTDEDRIEASTVAKTGFAPMDSDVVELQGHWQDQHLEGRTFQTTSQIQSSATVTFQGTGVIGFVRFGPGSGLVEIAVDGEIVPGGAGDDGLAWAPDSTATRDVPLTLVSGLNDATHRLTITLVSEGELTLGGVIVVREAPFLWPVMLLAATATIVLLVAVRSLVYLVAMRSGQLQRRAGVDLWPQLPQLPDWRPSRRV